MNKWQAVVFDLDDTLYQERDYVFSGFRAAAEWAEEHLEIPCRQGFGELKRLFEQGVRGNTFNRWLADHNLPPSHLVPQLVRVYRRHQPLLSPFPEVPELLTSLHQRYRLGLVSDGYLTVQQRKLAALGLAHQFDEIVFSDEWGREAWKPNPKPFETILRRLGTEASQSVYVADNPQKDFLGARQVGMFTIRVRQPGGEYADVAPPTQEHSPHVTVGSLVELGQMLNEPGEEFR